MTTVVVGTQTQTVTPAIKVGMGFDYSAKRVNDANETQFPSQSSQDKRVNWSSSLEDAQKEAAQKHIPYALYICAGSAFSVTGEGPGALLDYKKAHSGASPQRTIFDESDLVAGLIQSGIPIFVKVPKSQSKDSALAENSLVIFAPNDEKLDSLLGMDCNREKLAALIREFPGKWKQWQARAKALAAPDAGKR